MQSPSQLRDWTIYKITSPSNRVYIGITRNLNLRISNYKNAECKRQTLVYHSLLKYGWGAHSFEILDQFNSNSSYAEGKETFWIKSYMSNRNKYPAQDGMNLTDGGASICGFIMSEEVRQKISKKHLGKTVSLESRRKMSESKKGVNTYWPTEETKKKMSQVRMGFKVSEETKRKISETRKLIGYLGWAKGKKLSDTHIEKRSIARRKDILAYDLNGKLVGEFKGQKEIEKKLGVSHTTVWSSLSGLVKNPKQFIFKYK